MADHRAPRSVGYFETAYRDYHRQNPSEKLEHYLTQVVEASGNGPLDLLDIGCGLGSFLRHVSESRPEWRLHATDIDPAAVAATSEVVASAIVRLASAEEQPFPDDSFDMITAGDVIKHVPDLNAMAAAVRRMLRPGGRFLFVVPVYDGPIGWIVRLLDQDSTHVHRHGRSFCLDWAASWCRVSDWHGVFRYVLGPRYIHLPTRRARALAPAVLVSCEVDPHS